MLSAGPYVDDLPTLEPIVGHELTNEGWRGLTSDGQVFDVRSRNGKPAVMPADNVVDYLNGKPIGRRNIESTTINIDKYLGHHDSALELHRANYNETALIEINAAIALAPTICARFNRALILLALGRWHEGLVDYECRHQFAPSRLPDMEIPRWNGEKIAGKRLLLVHDEGFGDTIMMLRYVPTLRAMGADVSFMLPPELNRLVPSTETNVDFWCPVMSLLGLLNQTPEAVSLSAYLKNPYLKVDPELVQLPPSTKKRIGIAWSLNRVVLGDFPRAIPLAMLSKAVGGPGIELHSIQQHGQAEAEIFGVQHHQFADFAECAALISQMDAIVTIDTAAAHLAGALGHSNVTVLLSHWHSWRWRDNPFYPSFRLCRQAAPGDWNSALAML